MKYKYDNWSQLYKDYGSKTPLAFRTDRINPNLIQNTQIYYDWNGGLPKGVAFDNGHIYFNSPNVSERNQTFQAIANNTLASDFQNNIITPFSSGLQKIGIDINSFQGDVSNINFSDPQTFKQLTDLFGVHTVQQFQQMATVNPQFGKILQATSSLTPEQLKTFTEYNEIKQVLDVRKMADPMELKTPMAQDFANYMYGVSTAVQGVAALGSVYLAYSQYQKQNQQFKEQMEFNRENLENAKKSYNTQIRDKWRGRSYVGESSAHLAHIRAGIKGEKL